MNIYRQKIEEIRQEFMGSIRAQEEQILSLKAENEALRKDAERYRWLRRGENYAHQYLVDLGMENLEGFDRSIDAAMAKEANHG
ncbi:hypothetical protein V9K81_10150 [Pseudomonas monteilii]|uniref:hypothetical protein n=1 Tax=Pseudomonas monteilii TaxID=76759 RepID=UPI0030D2B0DA